MQIRHRFTFVVVSAALICAFVEQGAYAQGTVQGPNVPTTVTSTAGPFAKPWTSPGNASASDNIDTSSTVTAPLQQTDFLNATGFGFSIPADRVIRRIELKVEGRATTTISTVRVQLLKGGVPVGTQMSTFYPGTPTDGTVVFNDQDEFPYQDMVPGTIPLNLWGTTWTPAQINAADFGVRLHFEALSGSPVTFEVDNVRIWVYSFPTLPAAGHWALIASIMTVLLAGAYLLRHRTTANPA